VCGDPERLIAVVRERSRRVSKNGLLRVLRNGCAQPSVTVLKGTLEDRLEAAVRSAISERLMARQFGGGTRGSVQVEEHSPDNNSARVLWAAP